MIEVSPCTLHVFLINPFLIRLLIFNLVGSLWLSFAQALAPSHPPVSVSIVSHARHGISYLLTYLLPYKWVSVMVHFKDPKELYKKEGTIKEA